jgi:hypothetical protein
VIFTSPCWWQARAGNGIIFIEAAPRDFLKPNRSGLLNKYDITLFSNHLAESKSQIIATCKMVSVKEKSLPQTMSVTPGRISFFRRFNSPPTNQTVEAIS